MTRDWQRDRNFILAGNYRLLDELIAEVRRLRGELTEAKELIRGQRGTIDGLLEIQGKEAP